MDAEYIKMIEKLIDSHSNLFRRLNQINNKVPQPLGTKIALNEARELNQYFADKYSPKIVQSKIDYDVSQRLQKLVCDSCRADVNKAILTPLALPIKD